MITMTAVIDLTGPGRFSLEITGHASDGVGALVCAAVSAISNTCLLGLDQVAQHHPEHATADFQEVVLDEEEAP